MLTLGMMASQLVNSLLAGRGPHAWRYMLGAPALPGACLLLSLLLLPESPKWLVMRGELDLALATLHCIITSKHGSSATTSRARRRQQQQGLSGAADGGSSGSSNGQAAAGVTGGGSMGASNGAPAGTAAAAADYSYQPGGAASAGGAQQGPVTSEAKVGLWREGVTRCASPVALPRLSQLSSPHCCTALHLAGARGGRG
jgi:hypothetical protein